MPRIFSPKSFNPRAVKTSSVGKRKPRGISGQNIGNLYQFWLIRCFSFRPISSAFIQGFPPSPSSKSLSLQQEVLTRSVDSPLLGVKVKSRDGAILRHSFTHFSSSSRPAFRVHFQDESRYNPNTIREGRPLKALDPDPTRMQAKASSRKTLSLSVSSP